MFKKTLRWLYQPYKYLIFAPLVGIFTFFLGLLAMLLAFTIGEKIGSLCGVVWARLISWITPMRLTVSGRENIDPDQSYVVISNHQSQYDIMALYGWLGVDFKWIMKIEIRKVPVLGIACEKLGHVYIDRSDTAAALNSINRAKEKITGGTSVLFFPEGTRSKQGQLLPFKKGAFKMALDLGIPILPVTINNTWKILPTDTIDLFPGRASMTIHPPITIDQYSEASLPQLMEKVKATIGSEIESEVN